MIDDERWEILRLNIESLHGSCSELHASVAEMRRGMEENDKRLSSRMAELIENNIRLSNIIIAHDGELGDHERRLNDLEG